MNIVDHAKTKLEDKLVQADVENESLERYQLDRIHAVKRAFIDVSFKQAILTECYLRNCVFTRCDFTGAKFVGTNFKGSRFNDCKFHYTTWERSYLEKEFLESCLPSEENVARDLVRSLRVNFTQLGNYDAVNRAAAIEVRLTGHHFYNAAYSQQAYHRNKYKGADRFKQAVSHARWKFLDLLWGNGESVFRVILSALFVMLIATAALSTSNPDTSLLSAAKSAFYQFWGLSTQTPDFIAIGLVMSRFILFGLFIAILVKRLSRR